VWFTGPAYVKQVGQGFIDWSPTEYVANALRDGEDKAADRLIAELRFSNSTSYPSGYRGVLAK
jgi:hypothetical protein